ncbi:hypothetical protein V8E55_004999 [Tylopilus felleus]
MSTQQLLAPHATPQGSSRPAGGGDESDRVLSRHKHHIQELEDEIKELHSGQEAKNSANNVNKGRALQRVVSLFDNLTNLVHEYDRRAEIADQGLDDDPRGPFPHSPDQEHLYRGFQELLDFFPWIKSKLMNCEAAELERIFKDLRKGGDSARGDDAVALKKEVVNWLADLYAPILPPISPSLKVRKNIRERHPQFLVTDGSWLVFLYEKHRYDPDNTFKLIFTSPSSAQEVTASEYPETQGTHRRTHSSNANATDKNTRSHVACLIGMCSVKPQAIAYTAVQLCFALSNLTTWRMIDGDFNTAFLYRNIVDYFEAAPGPHAKARVQELLLWWDIGDPAYFGRCT